MTQHANIGNYALIGDSHAAALVSNDGSIDWLCLPRFDSPACFAALVGNEDNGCWRIAPAGEARASRRYLDDTLVLETRFETEDGTVTLCDFMPTGQARPSVVRMLTGVSGKVRMRMDLIIRFDYGRLTPWVSRREDGALAAIAGPHLLILATPAQCRGQDKRTIAEFTIEEGEHVPFCLTYDRSYVEPPELPDPSRALEETRAFWTDWASRCSYDGPWRDAVVRSLITLKALTYAPTGGIIAAPTTSIPERRGGERNWDYRYCWLRDATFTLLSLLDAGYRDEAESWRNWLLRAIAGNASQVQPLYTVLGENRIDEWEIPWLGGFDGTQPVRVGNAAFSQLQLDIFGEVLDALHQGRRGALEPTDHSWNLQKALLAHLETVRHEPDRGIWEVRGEKRHFTHSKVMIWVAFDRAVRAVEEFGLEGPVEDWRELCESLHAEVCARGFNEKRGAFTQSYDSDVLDASALLIPLVGFLPPEDRRIIGTLDAIERELSEDGLILRYDTRRADDGLPPGEGVFLACSFWFADNLILQGRMDEARALYERLLSLRNDVGLLAEEYDARRGVLMGNFPQALSHLALVDTAFNLRHHHAPARERSEGSERQLEASEAD